MLGMPGLSGRTEMLLIPGTPKIPEFRVMAGMLGMS